jgi:hypothetical protein
MRPARGAALCAASLNPQSTLRQKYKTLNIHALTAAARAASLNPTQSFNKNMRRSNIHAARQALRVFSQPEYPRSALQRKNIRRSTFMRGRGAARVQPA